MIKGEPSTRIVALILQCFGMETQGGREGEMEIQGGRDGTIPSPGKLEIVVEI